MADSFPSPWSRWAFVAAAFVAGCSKPQAQPDGITLYENGTNPVVLFHGLADNFGECMRLAAIYNKESQTDQAAWAAVGKAPDQWTCAESK